MSSDSSTSEQIVQHIPWARILAMPYAIQQGIEVEDTEEFADACLGFVKASKCNPADHVYDFARSMTTAIRQDRPYSLRPCWLPLRVCAAAHSKASNEIMPCQRLP